MSASPRNTDPARDLQRSEEAAAPAAQTHPRAAQPARRERLRMPLMVGVPLLMAAAGLYVYLTSGRYESTDDAYLRAAEVALSANVSGRVSEIDVRDNE